MNRRLFLLNGLAIVAVVCNHATHWGYLVLLADPNKPDLSGSGLNQLSHAGLVVAYYGLFAIEKLAVFSVPAFLFAAGCFAAFSSRTALRPAQPGLTASSSSSSSPARNPLWKIAQSRIVGLVVPHVIWSVVAFSLDALRGNVYSPLQYAARLVYGGALSFYFFVPVLCQLYVLLPMLAPLAKRRPANLLLFSGITQVVFLGLFYASAILPIPEWLKHFMQTNRHWSLAPVWMFFFMFGLVYGFHMDRFKVWLIRLRWVLLAAMLMLGLLAIAESNWFINALGINMRFSPLTLPSSLYAVACILCFLGFERVSFPASKALYYLSSRTFGIYLIHGLVLETVRFIVSKLLPVLEAEQLLYQPVLIATAVIIPLLVMASITRSPVRKLYPYLFG